MLQGAVVVVEPEQERPDDAAALVPAKPGHDTVRGALVLDLEHRPLVGDVWAVERLGHDTVESGALEDVEPPGTRRQVRCCRSEVYGGLGAGEGLHQTGPPGAERRVHERLVIDGEQVEGDERGRCLPGQQVDPGRSRVDALLQCVKVEAVATDHDDLAVDDAAPGEVGLDGFDDLREVAGHRPLIAAAELDLVSVSEHDGSEPVPLRLDVPEVGDLADGLGEHRGYGWHHGQLHASSLPRPRTPGERSQVRGASA